MSNDDALVLVGGYPDLDSARLDFDTLTEGVKAKDIAPGGAVLVAKDAEGKATVIDTGNHLGRKGAGWGAGVGVAVGLFAPALLASVTVARGRGRAGWHIRRSPAHERSAGQDRPSAGRRYRGDRRGVVTREPACRRAGARRVADEISCGVGAFDAAGNEGGVGRGDGQIQSRPHPAAAAQPRLRRDDGAHTGSVRRRLDNRARPSVTARLPTTGIRRRDII